MSRVAISLLMTIAVMSAQKLTGVTRKPSVISKEDPGYTQEARNALIEGEVWMSTTVTKAGLATKPIVMRSIGFGLDEEAVAAVLRWRFRPALRNGEPVETLAIIAVSFHLPGGNNLQNELSRNLAELRKTNDVQKSAKIAARIGSLSAASYPAAMHEYARLLRDGKIVPRNEIEAEELTVAAATARYGPAMWDVAEIDIKKGSDPSQGEVRKLIALAADFGSKDAQYFLGKAYEDGADGYAKDTPEAGRMFGTCAVLGHKQCQYRVGRRLVLKEERDEDDLSRGLAWLDLAQAGGVNDARVFLEQQPGLLTEERKKKINSLKKTLVHEF